MLLKDHQWFWWFHDKFASVIIFSLQTKLNMITAMTSQVSRPLCSMMAAIPDDKPSLNEIEEKKPSSSTGLINKLTSIAPSHRHCQVRRMSATFSTIKANASPTATLTFVSVAIVLSPRFSLNY